MNTFTSAKSQENSLSPLFSDSYYRMRGVRTRRIFAALIDYMIIFLLAFGIILGTMGLAFFWYFTLLFVIHFFYVSFSVMSKSRGTIGQRWMDLEVSLTLDGGRVPFINAAIYTILYYISCGYPLLFIVSLFESHKRCLHDLLAGVIIARRQSSPISYHAL